MKSFMPNVLLERGLLWNMSTINLELHTLTILVIFVDCLNLWILKHFHLIRKILRGLFQVGCTVCGRVALTNNVNLDILYLVDELLLKYPSKHRNTVPTPQILEDQSVFDR